MQTPRILNGPHGRSALALDNLVVLAADSVHTFGVGVGSFLTNDDTDGLRHTEAADDVIDFIVAGILHEDGVTSKNNQWLTPAECESGNYKLQVIPIGNLTFEILEDGLVTPVTDASIAAGTVFADLVVTAPTDTEEFEKNPQGVGRVYPDIRLDSDSIDASSTGKPIEILGVSRINGAVDGSPRLFKCRVTAAAAQSVQP
jgi:hypothetical protein